MLIKPSLCFSSVYHYNCAQWYEQFLHNNTGLMGLGWTVGTAGEEFEVNDKDIFPAAGPRIWNSLPPELQRPDTKLGEFRRLLKTFLFAYGQPRWRRTSDYVIWRRVPAFLTTTTNVSDSSGASSPGLSRIKGR